MALSMNETQLMFEAQSNVGSDDVEDPDCCRDVGDRPGKLAENPGTDWAPTGRALNNATPNANHVALRIPMHTPPAFDILRAEP
jgi:hypothetical protein